MIITAPCMVSLRCWLRDAQGHMLSEMDSAQDFLVGGDALFPKVQAALIGQTVGFETTLKLEPEDAFGPYLPELVCFESRSLLPGNIEVGTVLEGFPKGAQTPDMPADIAYTITEIYPDHVVLDGNHPLAGLGLHFGLTVQGVREATADEIAD